MASKKIEEEVEEVEELAKPEPKTAQLKLEPEPPKTGVGDIVLVTHGNSPPNPGIVTVVSGDVLNIHVFRTPDAGGETDIQLGAGDDGDWAKA